MHDIPWAYLTIKQQEVMTYQGFTSESSSKHVPHPRGLPNNKAVKHVHKPGACLDKQAASMHNIPGAHLRNKQQACMTYQVSPQQQAARMHDIPAFT